MHFQPDRAGLGTIESREILRFSYCMTLGDAKSGRRFRELTGVTLKVTSLKESSPASDEPCDEKLGSVGVKGDPERALLRDVVFLWRAK